MSIIQTTNLTKIYGKGDTAVVALDHINLKVKAGEFVAVMGPSGCGKSTLMHLIGGLDRPTEGSVVIDDHNLTDLKDKGLITEDEYKTKRREILNEKEPERTPAERLATLNELKGKGLITEEEYRAKRMQILSDL